MHTRFIPYRHPYPGICLLLLLGLLSLPVRADWYEDLANSVSEGDVNFNFRYRYEFVDHQLFDKDANASTLRSRLTFSSGALGAWSYGAEADYVAVVGSERYNSLANGRTDYPVVADPKGFDLNQVYLKYSKDDLTGTFGRQRINHAGSRIHTANTKAAISAVYRQIKCSVRETPCKHHAPTAIRLTIDCSLAP